MFGSVVLNQVAQFYTGQTDLQITFVNKPLQQSNQVFVQSNPYGTTWGNFLLFPLMLVCYVSLNVVSSRFDNGYYNLLMHKGGEKAVYVLSLYLSDAVVTFAIVAYAQFFQILGGIQMNGIWLINLIFSLSNPIFIILIAYTMQYARRKTGFSSTVVLSMALGSTYLMVQVAGNTMYTSTDKTFSTVQLFNFIPLSYFMSSGMFSFITLQYAQRNELNV